VRGSSGVAVGVTGVLVTGLLWWGAQDQSRTLDPHNAATAFVPPDGHRETGQDSGGSAYVEENARLTGPVALSGSPPLIGGALLSRFSDPSTLRIWRSVETSLEPDPDPATGLTSQSVTITRLSDRGLEELALYGVIGLVFVPPLLELPADVHAGSTWSGHGDAAPGGSVTYTATTSAEDAGHGCLHLTGKVVISTSDQSFPLPTDQTWCPGRGSVPTGDAGTTTWTGSTHPVTTSASAEQVAGWRAHRLRLVVAGSLSDLEGTGGDMSIALDQSPAALTGAGMAVVDSRSADVWGLAPVDGTLARAWIGHPGGDITGVGSAGQVTVVTTTHREAVGYGDHGQRLWTARLPDVSGTVPVAADDGKVVVTTVLGDVVVLDARTGHAAWHGSMSDQVGVAPVTDGRSVAVADIAGQVRLFDIDTGTVTWSKELPAPVDAMTVVGDRLVVVLGGVVESLSMTDGSRQWSVADDDAGTGTTVADVGGTVVVAGPGSTVGLDADSGRRRWSTAGAQTSVVLGRVLAELSGSTLVARDENGHTVGRWALDGLRGETRYLVADGAGVRVVDSVGDAQEVGP